MLPSVIQRFQGLNFILYGGDEDTISLIRDNGGIPIAWFTNKADIESKPVKQWYGNLFSNIYDAIYLIVTSGNMGRRKVEQSISTILNARTNTRGIVILHGYDSFDTTGLRVLVDPYNGGVIVSKMNDVTSSLMKVRNALSLYPGREIKPIHIPMLDIDPYLRPYIHLSSRIHDEGGEIIEGGSTLPVISDMDKNSNRREDTSLRSWKQRRMLISSMEFLNTMYASLSEEDRYDITIIYLNSAPGDHIERLADMYVQYNPSFHLWGDGDYPISASESVSGEYASIFIRPEEYGDVMPDPSKYGRVALISYAPMDVSLDMIERLDPIYSWIQFFPEDRYIDGDIHLPAWSTYGNNMGLIATSPYTMVDYNVESLLRSMRYFHNDARSRSYNMEGYTHVEGLCTCYDCSREIEVISQYLRLTEEPITEESIAENVTANTLASRPFIGRKANNRSLWSTTIPKIGPDARRHLVLYQGEIPEGIESEDIHASNMSILDIPIQRYNIILAYADDMSKSAILDAIDKKKPGSPLFLKEQSMSSIIKGEEEPILVNMHTDFTNKYDPSLDTGSLGNRHYSSYLQHVSLSKILLSPVQHLKLFSMR